MTAQHSMRIGLVVAAAGALGVIAWADASAATALTAAELRGKQMYTEGTSPNDDQALAFVGDEFVELPASALPCGSCHGPDGLGRPEGGVTPTDIRWSQLTKPYGHVHANGDRHPPYDDESMARVLAKGIDPAGNRLDTAMPIYALSERDMADLIAYMKRLETETDPGIEAGGVQVATLLPLDGPRGEVGQAMAQVLHAYFKEVNERGGVYGRRVELLVVPYGGSEQETIGNLRLALEREGIFALVGPYTVGLDAPLLELLRERGVPLVGAFTLDPGDAVVNENAFYLFPGFAEQARALAAQALQADQGKAPLLLIGPEGGDTDRLADAVQTELRGRKTQPALVVTYVRGQMKAEALAERAAQESSPALLFFGSQAELAPLLTALAERRHHPRVYLIGSLMSRTLFEMPQGFDKRIFLAYPTVPSDVSDQGRADYQGLAARHALPRGHVQGQLAAYAAARLLVEGLRGAGRQVTRWNMVSALEALYEYDTGVTPPLTYGPNRRIGARGAHVMVVDLGAKQYQPAGPWIEISR